MFLKIMNNNSSRNNPDSSFRIFEIDRVDFRKNGDGEWCAVMRIDGDEQWVSLYAAAYVLNNDGKTIDSFLPS